MSSATSGSDEGPATTATASLGKFLRITKNRTLHSQVVKSLTEYLKSHASTEDSWAAREHLAKALLDEGDFEGAARLVDELKTRFGAKSQRVGILEGLTLEAKGDWEAAKTLYEELIKKNWHNALAGKRLAALKRSRGDLAGAVQQLNVLLTDNHSDIEVWSELLDVYMTVGSYEQALFCAEELLLSNPHSYLSTCLYGELLFTCARATGMETMKEKWMKDSRAYLSQSLVLKSDQNPRAAWGLLVCVHAKSTSETAEKDKLDIELSKKAASMLRAMYAKSPMKDLVEPVISQLS